MNSVRPLVVVCGLVLAVPSSAADLAPWFVASERCEALQSKNTHSNPGGVAIEPGRAYRLLHRNAPGGEFFQLTVPDAPVTTARWVHVSCGAEAATAEPPPAQPGDGPFDAVLALSWQPAFCESRPGAAECRLLNAGMLPSPATQLSLHGLWPQDEDDAYCGVPARLVALDQISRWSELPSVDIDADTRSRLQAAMPGTVSGLDRHEWLKHGTCQPGDGGPDAYFDAALALAFAINRSEVGALLATRVGGTLRTTEIRAAFDTAFGRGAGERVQAHCTDDGRRTLLQELTVSLRGTISPDAPVAPLIRAAEPIFPGCSGGVVDPAGLQ